MDSGMIAALIICNVFALALIFVCWKWKEPGRLIVAVGFLAVGAVNVVAVLRNPAGYVEGFGPYALLAFYRDLIYGAFAKNPALFVIPIAVGQLIVALLVSLKGFAVKLGLWGGMVFLVAITPLGVGSGFPMTLLLIVALGILMAHSFGLTLAGWVLGRKQDAAFESPRSGEVD